MSTESRASNWLLNNKVAAVNQPITNKCHPVFSGALATSLLGPRFVILQFGDCQNAAITRLCSLKGRSGLFIFAPLTGSVPELPGLTGVQRRPFSPAQSVSQLQLYLRRPSAHAHRLLTKQPSNPLGIRDGRTVSQKSQKLQHARKK